MSVIVIVLLFVAVVVIFMQQASFGKLPKGARLQRIKQSPHYRDGKFQNLSATPDITEGVSYYTVIKEFFFQKSSRSTPTDSLPSDKVDLLHLNPTENILVWFGHSSYFMQIDGKKILVDPVFSGAASPVSFTTKSYKGSNMYSVNDFSEIDYLFLSHDHWDHTDHQTLTQLQPRVKQVFCGLGVGAHLEHWGYTANQIVEHDWYDETVLNTNFRVTATPARHFSGRGFTRNQSLWVSFVLQTPTQRLYIGGDSGYDTHFAAIGKQFGPFDLALLECGQYDKNWKYIHMMPEEVVQAAVDLKAKKVLPVHWAKFTLGAHAWDDPIIRVLAEAKKQNQAIIHPLIGQKILLTDDSSTYTEWWKGLN